MLRAALLLLVLLPLENAPPPAPVDGPTYTADGRLKFPANYREWIFLGSGIDMSYSAKPDDSMSMFNSVFVNPSAYRVFQQTGSWPEGTELVLENRGAIGDASINKHGKTESDKLMGIEVHVKDLAHINGTWGFYGFDDLVSAKIIDRPASCYTCHEAHAAVDTTFVQFYPTLLTTAKAKGTLSPAYLKEIATK